MSGPIVRKYGFPNFEQIFGKRELEHGVDEPTPPPPPKESQETHKDIPQAPTNTKLNRKSL